MPHNDADRRAKAEVPEEIQFRTKPEIALDLLDRAPIWGVPWTCVVAGADYGDNPNFLAGLEKCRQRYVAAVRCDFPVALSRRGADATRGRGGHGTAAAGLAHGPPAGGQQGLVERSLHGPALPVSEFLEVRSRPRDGKRGLAAARADGRRPRVPDRDGERPGRGS